MIIRSQYMSSLRGSHAYVLLLDDGLWFSLELSKTPGLAADLSRPSSDRCENIMCSFMWIYIQCLSKMLLLTGGYSIYCRVSPLIGILFTTALGHIDVFRWASNPHWSTHLGTSTLITLKVQFVLLFVSASCLHLGSMWSCCTIQAYHTFRMFAQAKYQWY